MAYFKANPRRGHTYYNLVETVQTEEGPRQQQLLYIGRIDTLTPEDRREIERQLAEVEPSLVPEFTELLVEHGYEFSLDEVRYSLNQISPIDAVDYGPVAALHAVAEKLDLRHVLETHLQPKGGGPPLGKLLLIQIIARCIEPRSITATTDWFPLTALPGLIDLSPDSVSADTCYNSLDYIDQEGIERVHEELWTRVQDLYDTPEDPLFYDLTSSYFEGTRCPLAKYGYSSEHRPDKQQLVMGVTVNPDMVPLQHDVYSGETNHSTTVDDVAQRIDELGIKDPVLVMDKGCATGKKRKRLRGEDPTAEFDPIDYVAALKNYTRVTDPLGDLDVEEFDSVGLSDGTSLLAVKELTQPAVDDEQVRWIATDNEEKAHDDADVRHEKLTEAGEELDTLAEPQHGNRSLSKEWGLPGRTPLIPRQAIPGPLIADRTGFTMLTVDWGRSQTVKLPDSIISGCLEEEVMTDTSRSREPDSPVERVVPNDVDSVLVATSAFGDGAARICGTLLERGGGAMVNYLAIAFDATPTERLEHWRHYVESDLPSSIAIVAVGEGTRSATAGESIQMNLPGADVQVATVQTPDDLTGISIAVDRLLSTWDTQGSSTVVCIDSLTTLLQYTDTRQGYRFLHHLLPTLTAGGATVHAHIDPGAHDTATLATIESLFEAVVSRGEDGEWHSG